MRAVAVPAGEHRVVFRYRPESLRSGAIATGASLLMTLALLATPWILRRKERLEAPPPPDDDFVASP
jgi:hypothetical protein